MSKQLSVLTSIATHRRDRPAASGATRQSEVGLIPKTFHQFGSRRGRGDFRAAANATCRPTDSWREVDAEIAPGPGRADAKRLTRTSEFECLAAHRGTERQLSRRMATAATQAESTTST